MAQAQGNLTGPIDVLTYRLTYRVSLTRHLAWRVFFECRSVTQKRYRNSVWVGALLTQRIFGRLRSGQF